MNIFELFGTIAINNEDANKAITETGSNANRLASTMKTSFDKIGKMAAQCGKLIASGMAVSATAVGSIVKASIDEYAEYEQLVGGVETLFKDSSDKVMQYAKQAYREQGLSANDYMSQVTSFSAALISGLNGDTAAAAEMANIAISDMADNANTFGTSITDIQNAYQGFAKDNYTMLDNLKLGYGGTAEEMARLINDSGVLGSSMKVTAEDVNNLSFDVIISAIHEVQTQMGITGKTAQEASETISGSWGALKGAWSNLLVGLANDEEMQPLADALLETGNTFVGNITEKLPTLKENFIETFTYIAENSGEILSTLGNALDSLFDVSTTDVWWAQILAGSAAMLTGHYALGLGLFAAAGVTEDAMWEEQAEKKEAQEATAATYQALVESLAEADPTLADPMGVLNLPTTTDGEIFDPMNFFGTSGEDSEEEDEGTGTTTQTAPVTLIDPMGVFNTGVPSVVNTYDPMNGTGQDNSISRLETILTRLEAVLNPETFKTAAKEGSSEGITEGLSGVTITAGNVTLNDGALVGRLLPQINLGMGKMIMQQMRG